MGLHDTKGLTKMKMKGGDQPGWPKYLLHCRGNHQLALQADICGTEDLGGNSHSHSWPGIRNYQ